jgi:hypothetical protein
VIQEPENLPVGWTDRPARYGPAAHVRTKQDGCNPQFPTVGELGFFIWGPGVRPLDGTFSPIPAPAGLANLTAVFFHGVSAPLLIHGALAALELVIGSAIHRHQGRQIFLGAMSA